MIALLTATALFLAPAADTPPPPSPVATAPVTAASGARTEEGPLTVFGGTVTVGANEVRDGDLTLMGGTVEVDGEVTHDVTVFGGSLQINGTVDHDVTVIGGSVRLGPTANIGHDVTVVGGSLDRAPGAQVGHDVTVTGGSDTGARSGFGPGRGVPLFTGAQSTSVFWPPLPGFGFGLVVSIGLVLLALLLHLFLPAQVERAQDVLEDRPVAALGIGCLTAVAGVLVAAVLGVTLILLPVSLVIAVAMGAAWILGWAAIIVLIGRRLTAALRWRLDPVPTLLVGGALIVVLVNVPILGGLFGLLAGAMALGAATLTRFGTTSAAPPFVPAGPMPPPYPGPYGPPPGPPAPPPAGPFGPPFGPGPAPAPPEPQEPARPVTDALGHEPRNRPEEEEEQQ